MRVRVFLIAAFLINILLSCSKHIDYTPEHINQTSGRYLYNENDIIEVFYEKDKLYLKWRGAEMIKPVVLDENTFFIADMYKKLRFVQNPETKVRYLSIVPEDDKGAPTYDYLKVSDSFKTPSMHLKLKEYDRALVGFLEIQKQDSTSVYINESDFNRMGYDFLRDQKYADAIEVFKINVALYPKSDNVYDSLGEAYLRSGDSLQAFTNYTKAYELNSGNARAKGYIKAYKN